MFRKYAPQNYVLLSLLSIFLEFTFGFILFAIRKKKPLTEEEYYKEMAKRRGYFVYRVNPNNYDNPSNPFYGYQNKPNKTSTPEEDPFPEFSDNNGNGSQNSSSKSDDLFD